MTCCNIHADANEDSLMTAEEMDVEEFLNGGFEALTRCREAMSVSRNSMENMNSLSSKTESGRGAQANGQGALAQRANVKASAMLVKEELKSHKAQLDSLQTADPEFFEYLKASDKTLLDFSDGDDDLEARSDGRTDELTNRHAAAADLYPSDNGDPATRKGVVQDLALIGVSQVVSLTHSLSHYTKVVMNILVMKMQEQAFVEDYILQLSSLSCPAQPLVEALSQAH